MTKADSKDASELSVKDLAETHLESAVRRLGKLVEHEDAEVALEAAQSIINMARPKLPGGSGFGGWPGGFGGWPGGFGGWPGGWGGGLGGWGGRAG